MDRTEFIIHKRADKRLILRVSWKAPETCVTNFVCHRRRIQGGPEAKGEGATRRGRPPLASCALSHQTLAAAAATHKHRLPRAIRGIRAAPLSLISPATVCSDKEPLSFSARHGSAHLSFLSPRTAPMPAKRLSHIHPNIHMAPFHAARSYLAFKLVVKYIIQP